jgi:hypothetical protein
VILEKIIEKKDNYLDILKEVDSLLSTLDSYKIQENLYKLQGEKLDVILASLDSCKLPNRSFTYKDTLREKFEEALKLGTLDIIIFVDNTIYIKYFLQIESKEDKERRACGLSTEELDGYKNEYFKDEAYKKIIKELLVSVMSDSLSYKKLTPYDFKKSFIAIFINMVEIVVIENTQITDSKVIKGLSLHLLREVFDELMLYISEDILFNFANQEKKAIEFLSFFGFDEKIDAKGVRYKPLPILDDNNNAWNMTTIKSAMIQHKKAKEILYGKKSSLIVMKKNLEVQYMEQTKLINLQEAKELEYKSVEESLGSTQKILNKLQTTTSQKVTYKDNEEEKTYDRKTLIRKLLKKEDDLLSQKNSTKKEYEDLEIIVSNRQKNIDIKIKKYHEEKCMVEDIEKKGHPADKLYNKIKKALAKTLVKR